ncbi:hypothetical protein PRIC1_006337 [Phytophthora ramorum]
MRLELSTGEVVFCLCAVALALYISPFFIDNGSSAWEFLLIWDDEENFLNNDVIQSLGLDNLYAMFTMTKINVYEPFGWLVKAIEVQLVGLDSWYIRLVSVAFHFTAAAVLARASAVLLDVKEILSAFMSGAAVDGELQRERERRHWLGCCISAVVFAIHPVHVEVMGWPSAQPYAQCALFSNLALYVYVRAVYRKLCEVAIDERNVKTVLMSSIFSGHGRSDLLCCVFYLSALLSKSVCILLPAGFFLVDVLVFVTLQPHLPRPGANHLWSYVAGKLPVAATLLTFLAVMLMSNYQGMHRDADVLSLTLTERVIKAMAMPAWIVRQILWPTKLRPHYQIRPGELSMANADYLLSISVLVALVLFTLWLFQHRCAPQHLLALAYFTIMVLPVSGLIQHGMVSAGCDRSCNNVKAVEDEKPEHVHNRDDHHPKMPDRQRLVSTSVVLLIAGTWLYISTGLMNNWRNEDVLLRYSLRMDPADWRILDQQATHFITSSRCTREDEECRHLWELSFYFTPRGTLKSDLQRLKLLVWLDKMDLACEGQGDLSEARQEFERALQTPGYEHVYAAPRANIKRFDEWVALKEDAQTRGEEESMLQMSTQIMY